MAKIIKLKKTKHKPKYKYALNEQVDTLPRSMPISELITHLQASGISRNEFYRDREIPYGSNRSIPSDRLFIYSKVFSCPVVDLLNEDIKATSIREKNFKLKTKLS